MDDRKIRKSPKGETRREVFAEKQKKTVIIVNQTRWEVDAWNGWFAMAGGVSIPSYEVSNLKWRGDRWRYLCPGADISNTMRWNFFTTVWKDPAMLDNPNVTSLSIRKRWFRWLRKTKRAYPLQTFVPSGDAEVIRAVKSVVSERKEEEMPKPSVSLEEANLSEVKATGSSSGECGLVSSNWVVDSKPECGDVLNISDNLLYSKISSDTDLAVLLALHHSSYSDQRLLLSNINLRLRLHYQISSITSQQASRIARLFDWAFTSVYSLFEVAQLSFQKAASFLNITLADALEKVCRFSKDSLCKYQDTGDLEKMSIKVNKLKDLESVESFISSRKKAEMETSQAEKKAKFRASVFNS